MLENANVWTAGYPAPFFEALHHGKIEELYSEEGEAALTQLVNNGLGQNKIIFVAHSLGGLLVKAILNRASGAKEDPEKKRIVENTRAVFFLGTPHAGSDRMRLLRVIPYVIGLLASLVGVLLAPLPTSLASALVSVPWLDLTFTGEDILRKLIPIAIGGILLFLLKPSRHVKLLDPANPQLRTLANDYRQVLCEHPLITTVAFHEMLPTGWFGVLGVLVPWSSADPGVTNCEPKAINASHTELCKLPYVTNIGLPGMIQKEVKKATRGKLSPVFGEDVEGKVGSNDNIKSLIKSLCDVEKFKEIPEYKDNEQARRIAEESLRTDLRRLIREGQLKPSAAQLEAAKESSFDLDEFVWDMWYETELVETLRKLREDATTLQQKTWPKEDAWTVDKWPSLIPFYRALRTVEHVYSGDFLGAHPREGAPSDRTKLLALVTEAYKILQRRCELPAADGTMPDSDGSTRWLLVRMECALRAMDVSLTFIGPWSRPSGRESEVAAHERLSKRERFLTALDKFKKAMEGDDSPHL